jgi:hypothetical protein
VGVNKAHNSYINSHVAKYWPLIGGNFNPMYWDGANDLAIFRLHQSIPEIPLIDFFLSDKMILIYSSNKCVII